MAAAWRTIAAQPDAVPDRRPARLAACRPLSPARAGPPPSRAGSVQRPGRRQDGPGAARRPPRRRAPRCPSASGAGRPQARGRNRSRARPASGRRLGSRPASPAPTGRPRRRAAPDWLGEPGRPAADRASASSQPGPRNAGAVPGPGSGRYRPGSRPGAGAQPGHGGDLVAREVEIGQGTVVEARQRPVDRRAPARAVERQGEKVQKAHGLSPLRPRSRGRRLRKVGVADRAFLIRRASDEPTAKHVAHRPPGTTAYVAMQQCTKEVLI